VLQCKTIRFSGCKQRYNADGSQNKPGNFLEFPYFSGVTFSSQDMDNILTKLSELDITEDMIQDPPPVTISNADGEVKKICPWQEAWMQPLKQLYNRKIYVKSSETGKGSDDQKYFGQRTDGTSFQDKFLNFERYADHEENMRRDSFDAGYALAEGERATSILDWERRIFLQLAKTNNLTIVHLADGLWGGEKEAPAWYRHYPDKEAEAVRRFEMLES